MAAGLVMQPYLYEKKKLQSSILLGQDQTLVVPAGLKAIDSCCNDPTIISDLQTEKTIPPTDTTNSIIHNQTLCVHSQILCWVWLGCRTQRYWHVLEVFWV
jgi:hypothetical protein